MLTEAYLAAVTEAVFDSLRRNFGLPDRLRAVLDVGPERKAFQTALAGVYTTFAQRYPELATALFDERLLATGQQPDLYRYRRTISFTG
ncbi:hypothetical protein [Chloroflexus sp.]|uniref:hypothetical protein n=1 Tax=Chloroflexus sp. TaxID=1904827 RepID=UPI00258A9403|nr:hypothetical protein [Chloroflexus sp.]